jgi:hypothetical protein
VLNIVYYTSGITGSGRLVKGLSIANALKRFGVDFSFTLLHSCQFGKLAEELGFKEYYLEPLPMEAYSAKNYNSSNIYKVLNTINPDVLIVDLVWFTLHRFIEKLDCLKIFLTVKVTDNFFTVPLDKGIMEFDSSLYDYAFTIEPFDAPYIFDELNPFILRDKSEILSKEEALQKLNLDMNKRYALYAFNGEPGEFEKYMAKYEFIKDEGFNIVYSSNYKDGIFPILDYYNAFEKIICGAGYNQFWEAVYLKKDVHFEPSKRVFEKIEERIQDCSQHYFETNGADELVTIIYDHFN